MWFISFSSSSGDQRPRLSLFFGPHDRFGIMLCGRRRSERKAATLIDGCKLQCGKADRAMEEDKVRLEYKRELRRKAGGRSQVGANVALAS
jgi:hypothetical protein